MNKRKFPTGPKGNFLLGSTKDFAKDTIGFVSRCCEEFKNIALAKIAFRDFYLLFQPEYIHYVLQDNYKNYHKSFAYKGFRKILGNGLLTSEGDFWLKQRRLSQPAFHKEKLAYLVRNMHSPIQQLIQDWSQNGGGMINFTSAMRLLSQELVTASLFSTSVTVSQEKLDWILEKLRTYANDKMKNPFMPPLFVPTSFNRTFLKAMKELDEVIYELIQFRKESNESYQDFLSMLMEARDPESGESMSLQQLRDEIATIFIAGQETTANALCFIFYLLSKHPDVEQKLKEEIRSGMKDKDFSIENISKLQYTSWVIKESLRLYPPAWAVSRQAVKDDEIDGYFVPAKATVFLSIYAMHRDERYWENPNQFIPERFEPSRFNSDQKMAYLPFGTGARICIGNNFALLEMQLVLAALYSHFNFTIAPGFIPDLKTPVTLRFKNDILFQIEKI